MRIASNQDIVSSLYFTLWRITLTGHYSTWVVTYRYYSYDDTAKKKLYE